MDVIRENNPIEASRTGSLTQKNYKSSICHVPKMVNLRKTIKSSAMSPLLVNERPISYGAITLKAKPPKTATECSMRAHLRKDTNTTITSWRNYVPEYSGSKNEKKP